MNYRDYLPDCSDEYEHEYTPVWFDWLIIEFLTIFD